MHFVCPFALIINCGFNWASTFIISYNYLVEKSKTIRLSSGMIRKPEPGSFVNTPCIADIA